MLKSWPAGQGLPDPFQPRVADWVQATFTIRRGNLAATLSTPFHLRSGFASPSIVCTPISSTRQALYAGNTTYASSTASFIISVNPSTDPNITDDPNSSWQFNQ